MGARAAIDTAMVLAAGLGTRMRPITDRVPKPLVTVGGRTLLDHTLDPLAAAGVRTAVVNVHHLADQIERAVAGRTSPRVVISDERAELLDSGGGVVKALAHLGEAFFLRNADSFWLDAGADNLVRMIEAFDPAQMESLLLLAPTPLRQETGAPTSVGFDGPGDFFLDAAGRLTRRGAAATAPFAYAGAAILTKDPFLGRPVAPFSLNAIWNDQIARGALHGLVLDGLWLHVGTPDSIGLAEQALRRRPGPLRRDA